MYLPKPLNQLILAVDFDGTCVTHEYPNIGKSIGAEPVLHRLVQAGVRLILWTMRSDETNHFAENGDLIRAGRLHLTEAVEWFHLREIPLWGVQRNPEQDSWSTSFKAYAHLYLDDAALGAPLTRLPGCERPVIDWRRVETMFFGDSFPKDRETETLGDHYLVKEPGDRRKSLP